MDVMNKRIRRIIYSLFVCSMAFTLFACSANHETSQLKPALSLSVKYDATADQTSILQETSADKRISRVFLRPGISNALINIDGHSYSLGTALQENIISAEDITLMVRKDSKNGFCTEEYASIHGLAHFTYHYADFNIRVIFDIYETPASQQYLISDICIYPSDRNLGSYTDFYDSSTGNRIDWEDWGITFDCSDISPTGLTLHCHQSGGQQIGQLQIISYSLSNQDGFIPQLNNSYESPSLNYQLKMNGETEIPIKWEEEFGSLPSGDYQILFYVLDIFDDASVHPLMEDYHIRQAYSIAFTIPS